MDARRPCDGCSQLGSSPELPGQRSVLVGFTLPSLAINRPALSRSSRWRVSINPPRRRALRRTRNAPDVDWQSHRVGGSGTAGPTRCARARRSCRSARCGRLYPPRRTRSGVWLAEPPAELTGTRRRPTVYSRAPQPRTSSEVPSGRQSPAATSRSSLASPPRSASPSVLPARSFSQPSGVLGQSVVLLRNASQSRPPLAARRRWPQRLQPGTPRFPPRPPSPERGSAAAAAHFLGPTIESTAPRSRRRFRGEPLILHAPGLPPPTRPPRLT